MTPQQDPARLVERVFRDVDGRLTYREGLFLYHAARRVAGETTIVEIGSWKGRSTICLAKGAQAGNQPRVYAIDPHTSQSMVTTRETTYEAFLRNIERAGVRNLVVPIVATSEAAAAGFARPIGLLFVDGDHGYEGVNQDFTLWYPKVDRDGLMAFHDTFGWPGPTRVVEERVLASRRFRDIGFVDSVAHARKTPRNRRVDLLSGRLRFYLHKARLTVNPGFIDNMPYTRERLLARRE